MGTFRRHSVPPQRAGSSSALLRLRSHRRTSAFFSASRREAFPHSFAVVIGAGFRAFSDFRAFLWSASALQTRRTFAFFSRETRSIRASQQSLVSMSRIIGGMLSASGVGGPRTSSCSWLRVDPPGRWLVHFPRLFLFFSIRPVELRPHLD